MSDHGPLPTGSWDTSSDGEPTLPEGDKGEGRACSGDGRDSWDGGCNDGIYRNHVRSDEEHDRNHDLPKCDIHF